MSRRAERDRRVGEVAALLELSDLLERKPGQLSGGQRQRVAMGRAIVREPSVYLMDEPLSNLDAKLRVQMRADIAALQARLGVTTVYVTHDQSEAMTLGSRVAVLKDGRLQQCAPPRELYERPANAFVAGFIGSPAMSLVEVPLGGNGSCDLGGARLPLTGGDGRRRVGARALARCSSVCAPRRSGSRATGSRPRSRPSRCSAPTRTSSAPRRSPAAETKLTARADARRAPERGEAVRLEPQSDDAHLFDPESGERLPSIPQGGIHRVDSCRGSPPAAGHGPEGGRNCLRSGLTHRRSPTSGRPVRECHATAEEAR